MCHETKDLMPNLRKKLICCFKKDKNLANFDRSTEKSQKYTLLMVPFTFDLKKYRVFFHNTEE